MNMSRTAHNNRNNQHTREACRCTLLPFLLFVGCLGVVAAKYLDYRNSWQAVTATEQLLYLPNIMLILAILIFIWDTIQRRFLLPLTPVGVLLRFCIPILSAECCLFFSLFVAIRIFGWIATDQTFHPTETRLLMTVCSRLLPFTLLFSIQASSSANIKNRAICLLHSSFLFSYCLLLKLQAIKTYGFLSNVILSRSAVNLFAFLFSFCYVVYVLDRLFAAVNRMIVY